MTTAIVIALAIQYAACLLLFGAAVFGRVTGQQAAPRSAWIAAAAIALASAVAMVFLQAGSMSGSWSDAIDGSTIVLVLTDTVWGHVWAVRLATAALLVVAIDRRPSANGLVALSGVLIASLALSGHAYAIGGPILAINQALHLSAAGAWFGALPALIARAVAMRGHPGTLANELRRFSRYAIPAVVLIVATGSVNSVVLGGGLSALVRSGYGETLAAKLVLVAAMIAFAAVNRLWLVPRLDRGDAQAAPLLIRAMIGELGLGAAVVIVAILLGTLPPPGAG